MDKNKRRALYMGWYILTYGATFKEVAKAFKVDKATVRNDITKRLPEISTTMAKDVYGVLESIGENIN